MKFDLPYVLKDRDRHGNVRIYFRKRGCRKIRLPDKVGSAEFLAAYNAALNAKACVYRKPYPGLLSEESANRRGPLYPR
jgi:hypothetical protein